MSKAQYSDYRSSLVTAVERVYPKISTNSAYSIFLPWDELDLHFIFSSEISGVSQLIVNRATVLLQRSVLMHYKFFDFENEEIDTLFSISNVDSRVVQISSSSAQENQPINATIDEITSPTAKQVGSSSGTDTNTSDNINDQIKLAKYLSEVKSFSSSVRTVLSPLIEEFSEMY